MECYKIKNFLINGIKGLFVRKDETVRSFKAILEGKGDHLPEQAFMYVGNIEEAEEKAAILGL